MAEEVATAATSDASQTAQMSLGEKREKIRANYETIEVLKNRLEEERNQGKIGMTRAAYIKMIFDVTKKVDKQNDELSKAISDARHLQRDISNLNGRLERSFKHVEEIILKDARNDVWSRECYLMLSSMHENCDQLMGSIQEIGELTREIRQLEDEAGQSKLNKLFDN